MFQVPFSTTKETNASPETNSNSDMCPMLVVEDQLRWSKEACCWTTIDQVGAKAQEALKKKKKGGAASSDDFVILC